MKKVLILLFVLVSIFETFSKETYTITDYSYRSSKVENYIYKLGWSVPIKIDSSYTIDIDESNKTIIVHGDIEDVFKYNSIKTEYTKTCEISKTKVSDINGNIIDIIIYKYNKQESRIELYYSFDTMMKQSGFVVKYNLRRKI